MGGSGFKADSTEGEDFGACKFHAENLIDLALAHKVFFDVALFFSSEIACIFWRIVIVERSRKPLMINHLRGPPPYPRASV